MGDVVEIEGFRKPRSGDRARDVIIAWLNGPPCCPPGTDQFSEKTADALLAWLWCYGLKIIPLDGIEEWRMILEDLIRLVETSPSFRQTVLAEFTKRNAFMRSLDEKTCDELFTQFIHAMKETLGDLKRIGVVS